MKIELPLHKLKDEIIACYIKLAEKYKYKKITFIFGNRENPLDTRITFTIKL